MADEKALQRLRQHARETAARFEDEAGRADYDAAGERDALAELNRKVLKGCADAGLLELPFLAGLRIGDEDILKAAVTVEGLAARSGVVASIFTVNVIFAGSAIALMGYEGQRRALLPAIASGDMQLAFSLTEPMAGTDAAGIRTTARCDAEGFLLTGEKTYATGALTATRILVVAKIADCGDERAAGVFVVDPELAGVTIRAMPKLAGNAQPSCHIKLDGVRVAREDLLGGEDGYSAWSKLRITGALERLMVAASAVGMAERIVEEASQFVLEREQFGKKIFEFQSVQHLLVDLRTRSRLMRLVYEDALKAMAVPGDPTAAVCIAKYFCAEALQDVVQAGMRIFGGRAYVRGHIMERIYRDAPLALYAGGTVELQKNLIARSLGT